MTKLLRKYYRFPMLSIIGVLIVLVTWMVDARAASSITPTPGSITIVYTNAAGTVTYSPAATISNADAAAFVAWCQAKYIATPAAATAKGCFDTWANDWFNQTKAGMLASSQVTAADNATKAVVPPAIVPAQ